MVIAHICFVVFTVDAEFGSLAQRNRHGHTRIFDNLDNIRPYNIPNGRNLAHYLIMSRKRTMKDSYFSTSIPYHDDRPIKL